MARLHPFRAIYYTPNKFDLKELITPPYDNIPPGEDERLFNRHEFNFAHISLPKKKNIDYREKKALLDKWIEQGVFTHSKDAAFYLYQQEFELRGKKLTRRTLMAGVTLCEFSEGVVRPHELTHEGPKEDRLRILRETKCNLSPILAAVKDKSGILNENFDRWTLASPLHQVVADDGISHRLWKISPDKATGLVEFFKREALYIIDGHHRYSSALNYAKELGVVGDSSHPASQMFFAIANTYDPAVVALPTHRMVNGIRGGVLTKENLESVFEVKPATFEDIGVLVHQPSAEPSFIIHFQGQILHCTPKDWKSKAQVIGKALSTLSVVWSDQILLQEICGLEEKTREHAVTYEKSASQLWEKREQADLSIFLPPIRVEAMTAVADECGYMPQKSTFFYPKLASGLLVRSLMQ